MSASIIAFTGKQGLIHIADMGCYAQWRSIAACLIIGINRPMYTNTTTVTNMLALLCASRLYFMMMMMMIMMMICNM